MVDYKNGINILVVGSGGRENAIASSIIRSPKCGKLYIAPGNGGSSEFGIPVAIAQNDFDGLFQLCREKDISLVVVGPEGPLVAGMVDFFRTHDPEGAIGIIGPDKKGAQLEGSKQFSKQFMQKYGIPTANARAFTFSQLTEALRYLKKVQYPIVIKADGLAAGKGVIIASTMEEASDTVRKMLEQKAFGDAGETILIEDYMHGMELSMFVLTDGQSYVLLPEAKDYKRIGEGDTGLNTGGMGAVSPLEYLSPSFFYEVEQTIIRPTVAGLAKEGIDYCGFIFFGLMNMDGKPYVIEYNARMGDPETEVVFPRIDSDVLEMLCHCAKRKLNEYTLKISDKYATTVVVVSGGYPGSFEKGKEVRIGKGEASIFHAGTKLDQTGKLVTEGGRVLAVTGFGSELKEALDACYNHLKVINFEGAYYRKDIGSDVMKILNNQ